MAFSQTNRFLLVALNALLFLCIPIHCRDDSEVLEGLNRYRQRVHLPSLAANPRAACLAGEISELLEDEPCERVAQYLPNPAPYNYPHFKKFVSQCAIAMNTTVDGVILPVCKPNLETDSVVAKYTKTLPHEKYLDDAKFIGAGIASEKDWMVLVLVTDTPTGGFAASATSELNTGIGHYCVLTLTSLFMLLVII